MMSLHKDAHSVPRMRDKLRLIRRHILLLVNQYLYQIGAEHHDIICLLDFYHG